jgi:hypothetical protein
MSVTKANSAAGFIFLVTPNWLAVLSELVKSLPAFASPRTCAPESCACKTKEEKSDVASGTRTAPTTLPPQAFTTSAAAS